MADINDPEKKNIDLATGEELSDWQLLKKQYLDKIEQKEKKLDQQS